VVDGVRGALCLEGTRPGHVMRALQTHPMLPTGFTLEMGWLDMETFKSAYKMSDMDLGVAFGLQWGFL